MEWIDPFDVRVCYKENGDSVIAVLFLSLSVAFIAAGSYRMFYPRKVR